MRNPVCDVSVSTFPSQFLLHASSSPTGVLSCVVIRLVLAVVVSAQQSCCAYSLAGWYISSLFGLSVSLGVFVPFPAYLLYPIVIVPPVLLVNLVVSWWEAWIFYSARRGLPSRRPFIL